jgi:hypothetical protein
MPRYFFHLESGEIKVPDTKGREFSCIDDALFHAQMIVRRANTFLEEEDGRWIFRIQNAQDNTEMVVLFPRRQPQQPRQPRPDHKPTGTPAA